MQIKYFNKKLYYVIHIDKINMVIYYICIIVENRYDTGSYYNKYY